MTFQKRSSFAAFFALAALSALSFGCSSAEEVHVTGTVSSALAGPIHVEIFDVADDGEEQDSEPVLTLDLTAPGPIDARPEIAGDRIVVRATQDVDGDGACSDGDPWAEATVQVLREGGGDAEAEDSGANATVALSLAVQPCP